MRRPSAENPAAQTVCPWPASRNGLPSGPGRGVPECGSQRWISSLVAAAGRRPAPVRAEGRGEHDIVVAGIGGDLLPRWLHRRRCSLPSQSQRRHRSTAGACHRAEAQGTHTVRCLAVAQKARRSAPRRARPTAGFRRTNRRWRWCHPGPRQGFALYRHGRSCARSPCHRLHAPEPQIMIEGARHRAAAIGAEANGVDIVLMPFEPVQQLRLRYEGTGT